MTEDKGILIRNIFYMLTYAFQELCQNKYEKIATENFDNIHDLFAEILSRGIAYQLKQGLRREYVSKHETMSSLKGKLDIDGSVKNLAARKRLLDCDYDELSIDNIFNRIIKTTAGLLINHGEVRKERKVALKKLLLYFSEVSYINPSRIVWSTLRFDSNSRTYRMLMYICYFVLDNLVMRTESGEYAMHTFSDEHMSRLYEKFILEYYKRHHPECKPRAAQVKWNFDMGQVSAESLAALPIMQTDIFLEVGTRTLIIDAKYYSHSLSEHIGKYLLLSPNFYQINSYVLNYDTEHSGLVDGLLLYAQTQAEGEMDYKYPNKDGNVFYVKSLDLNQDFQSIKNQLDNIIINAKNTQS